MTSPQFPLLQQLRPAGTPAFFFCRDYAQRSPRAPIRPQPGRSEVTDRINRAFGTSDIDELRHAIGAAIRLYNISDIAKVSGLERQTIYRAFEGDAKHPNFRTVLSVLDAWMGWASNGTSQYAGMRAPDWRARKPIRAAPRKHTSRPAANRKAQLLAGPQEQPAKRHYNCSTARSSSTLILHLPTVVRPIATSMLRPTAGFQSRRTKLPK